MWGNLTCVDLQPNLPGLYNLQRTLEITFYIHTKPSAKIPFHSPTIITRPLILLLPLNKMAERTRTQDSTDIFDTILVAAPGTEVLMDEGGPGATERRLHKLQHTKSGDGHIILVPQPSLIDPNDPLRWSAFKKWTVLANGVCLCFQVR
jgi:hypothetical protein